MIPHTDHAGTQRPQKLVHSTLRSMCALALMAKAPRAGAVKTRLVPPLTPDEAATLSLCFLRDLATNIAEVSVGERVDGIVIYTPAGEEEAFKGALPRGFGLLPQRGESLGERVLHGAEDLQASGYGSFCLINADSPTLPRSLLTKAAAALERPGDRVVLGPATDGGYYLIGLKRAHARLFTHIDWSTERVFTQTIERAAEIGLEVKTLPSWYDVDDVASLRRLCDELFSSNENPTGGGLIGFRAPYTRDYLTRVKGGWRARGII